MPKQNKLFVLSLGGSVMVPGVIDTAFLRDFVKVISAQARKGHRFIIVTGGGGISRQYAQALRSLKVTEDAKLAWLGIYVTRLNGELLKDAFGSLAYPKVVDTPDKISFSQKVLIAAGWKPGRSTDDVAVRLAVNFNVPTVFNLTNTDYVYTADPKTHKDATKIERMTWKSYRHLLDFDWGPGMHAPFDPVAAKSAQKGNIEVYILNGRHLKNLTSALDGKKFNGTVIS